MALKTGSVVWANVLDPQGRNQKYRGLLVISPDPEATPNEIVCVAITGTFTKPLDEFAVLLPYSRQGYVRTGLTKECIANCRWFVTITQDTEYDHKGEVDGDYLNQVLEKVNAFKRRQQEDAAR